MRLFLLACALSAASCWIIGGALVAPAQCTVALPATNLPVAEHTLATEIGGECAAWHIPNPQSEATVILAHPLRGNRRSMLGRAQLFHRLGYSVLLIDLQAHGESSGKHITFGHLEQHDILAAVAFVQERNPDHRIAIDGWSLGGAAALLASSPDVDAIILESVYSTINAATQNRILRHKIARRLGPLAYAIRPLLTCQLSIRLGVSARELRPVDWLPKCGCPVLIMAGSLDEHTTLAETESMFAAAEQPKALVLFPRAKHEDLLRADRTRYEQSVAAFLRTHLVR